MYCIIRVKSNPYIFLSQILNSALWDLNLARLDISKNSFLVPLIIIRSFPKKQQNMSQGWGHSRRTSFIIYLSILGTYMYALQKMFEDNCKEIDHICVLLQEGFRDIRDLGIICSYNVQGFLMLVIYLSE